MHGPELYKRILKEMHAWMKENKVFDLSEIVGVAHG
jgi:dihydroorotate dehydrogenase